MKTTKFLLPIVCIGLIAMSCSKSSTPAPVSPADAKTAFNSVNDDLANEMQSLSATPGYSALTSTTLTGSGSPIGRVSSFNRTEIRSTLKSVMSSARKILFNTTSTKRVSGNEPFVFADHTGIYTWNFDTQKYDYNSASSIIEIKYPTDGSTTNNADFQLTAYSEQATPNGDEAYSPTVIKASISIDGTKQASIDYSASYGSDDQPNQASISLFLNPYTFTLDFDDSKATSSSESFSLSKSGKLLIGTGISATYPDNTKSNPSSVTGYIQLEDVRFTATIDGNKAATSNDPNDFVTGTVTINGGVAGHVIFVANDQSGGYDPYVQYNDGTQDPLQTLFQSLGDQLQTLFS